MSALDEINRKLDILLERTEKKTVRRKPKEHGIIPELDVDLPESLREKLIKCPIKTQKRWLEAYGLSVVDELMRADLWLLEHPRRMGTAAFFGNWLRNSNLDKDNLDDIDLD